MDVRVEVEASGALLVLLSTASCSSLCLKSHSNHSEVPMTSLNPAASGLFLSGQRESGDDVRVGNVTAAVAVANVVKTSLGPVGLDKMLVDDIGDVTVTNDGATILGLLELEHPAARLLVDLAQLQDREVGDGTTSVVLIAAELLRRGNDLVRSGIHPTTVLAGYKLALKEAIAFLKSNIVVSTSNLDDGVLLQAARTSMSSKLIGPESQFFAAMAVDAVRSVRTKDGRYPLSAIHVLKVHGKSALDSRVMTGGFALACSRASQGMPTRVEPKEGGDGTVKVCLLDMGLQRHRMAMGVQIQVKDAQEVDRIQRHEVELTRQKVRLILDAGANVVLTSRALDDVVLKYFVEAGVLACRRVPREDLRRLAKATGGSLVSTLADLDGNESFDPASLGSCESVSEVRVGDGEMLQFSGCRGAGASTILLRGANSYVLDETDRSLHDAMCAVKRVLESSALVPGGGAVEAALSVHLERHAKRSVEGREQYAVQEFASSLLVIPKQLAVNAAKDSSDLVARLRAVHARSQQAPSSSSSEEGGGGPESDPSLKNYGLDLASGAVRDNLAAGVVEPAVSKIKSLRFATEAAVTILRIDDRITVQADPR